MEGRIDNGGCLGIYRKGALRPQYCMHQADTEKLIRCGDGCPQFGEPVYYSALEALEEFNCAGPFVKLTICQNRNLVFENLIDKRNA